MNTNDLAARFSTQKSTAANSAPSNDNAGKMVAAGADESEAEVCFICASPVVHEALMPCNHRTCHICCLRMRALYKDKNCMHCRVSDRTRAVMVHWGLIERPDASACGDLHG
jgi:hypothetical protein